ncbi:hypothetical protein EW146_g7766, partial [Bondarzewia mesenterica]
PAADSDAEEEEEEPRKKRRERKQKEKEQYKSAQFVEDSDEEYGRDIDAFFERERALRERAERAAVDSALGIGTMKKAGTKKRRQRAVGGGDTKRRRKATGEVDRVEVLGSRSGSEGEGEGEQRDDDAPAPALSEAEEGPPDSASSANDVNTAAEADDDHVSVEGVSVTAILEAASTRETRAESVFEADASLGVALADADVADSELGKSRSRRKGRWTVSDEDEEEL